MDTRERKVSARGRDEGVKSSVAHVATSHDLQKKFLTHDTEVLFCMLKLWQKLKNISTF